MRLTSWKEKASETSLGLPDGAAYFNIRARDNADFWSSSYRWIGQFLVDGNEPEVPAPSRTSHTTGVWSVEKGKGK